MNKENKLITVIAILCAISIVVGIAQLFIRSKYSTIGKNYDDLGISASDKGIAVIYIYGTIEFSNESRLFPGMPSEGSDKTVSKLRQLSRDNRVKAVVLRINSPGGTIGASQEIYNEVINLRKKGVPVVTSMGDIAASGGYYIASASDVIFANPGSLTGSIGVIAGSVNLVELFKKLGIQANVIKSGPHKDMLGPWRNLTEEERSLLQNLINEMKNQFITDVSVGRKMDKEKISKLADGRVFSGLQAKTLGLIDKIGNMNDALDEAMKLAKLEGPPRIIYRSNRPFQFLMELLDNKLGTDPVSAYLKNYTQKENIKLYY